MKLTKERLVELLHYDPKTGIFCNRSIRRGSRLKPGEPILAKNGDGYRIIAIDGVRYSAAKLAWLYNHGEWPDHIDHINRIRDDDRIVNLRKCTISQNLFNRNFKSKISRGVYKITDGPGYYASITKNYKYIYLGRFTTLKDAEKARREAAVEHFGEFAQ